LLLCFCTRATADDIDWRGSELSNDQPKAQQAPALPPTPSPSPLKKRKRGTASSSVENELLPGPAPDEGAVLGSLDFHEVLNEDALRLKSAIVNRAPVMMAWACVVAERLGFSREEALSIGKPHLLSIPVSYHLFTNEPFTRGFFFVNPCPQRRCTQK
jgi:hypothetical protein